MRNTFKALQSNTATSGSTVVQLTVESLDENLFYADSLSETPGTPSIATYGQDYAVVILAHTPTAYYRLAEAAGPSAFDSSGNGYTGTYASAGVTYSEPGALVGNPNPAVLLDGASGLVTCPAGLNPAGWSAITVECWFKLSTTSFVSYPRLVANGDAFNANVGFELYLSPGAGGLFFAIGNGSTHVQAPYGTPLSAGMWYYAVGVLYSGTLSLYLNGSLVATSSVSGAIGASGSPITLGALPAPTNWLPGELDEVAIYNWGLNASQVAAHYTAGQTLGSAYGYSSYN
jgi:hypothetical protein